MDIPVLKRYDKHLYIFPILGGSTVKNKIKTILAVILTVTLALSPFIFAFGAVVLLPSQFENDFVGAIDKKFERLTSLSEDKIVVVGGSSVAFGLDSALLEEAVGMPVVNFGLYAALGTKLMLDLSLAGIEEGDVVVIAPELDAQTLSMYFSAEHTLAAFDGNYSLIRYVRGNDRLSLLGGLWAHGVKKIDRFINGAPDPLGVYNSKNINEYGDLVYERSENVMARYYDPNTPIELSESIVSADFLDYLNEYTEICKKRGAKVFFSYSPMNEMAITESSAPSALESFFAENLEAELISFIDDYIMEAGYFYDTNYHPGDAGVIKRTRQLAVDINFALGNNNTVNITVPSAPPLPERSYHFFGEDENARFFTYEKTENGSLRIVGLTEEGRAQESLTLPLGADGFKVTELDTAAFVGARTSSIVITEGSNLRQFLGEGFGNTNVKALYIYYDNMGVDTEILYPIGDFGGVTAHVKKGALWPDEYLWDPIKGIIFVYDLE